MPLAIIRVQTYGAALILLQAEQYVANVEQNRELFLRVSSGDFVSDLLFLTEFVREIWVEAIDISVEKVSRNDLPQCLQTATSERGCNLPDSAFVLVVALLLHCRPEIPNPLGLAHLEPHSAVLQRFVEVVDFRWNWGKRYIGKRNVHTNKGPQDLDFERNANLGQKCRADAMHSQIGVMKIVLVVVFEGNFTFDYDLAAIGSNQQIDRTSICERHHKS